MFTHCQFEKAEIVSITDYVKRIKSQLDTYGFSTTDFTYYLNAEQKRESGGYDVIIQYKCKQGLPLTYLNKAIKAKRAITGGGAFDSSFKTLIRTLKSDSLENSPDTS